MEMNFMSIIGLIILVLMLFLAFREAVCWYWKINQRVELLKSIKASLDQTDKNSKSYDNVNE